MFGEKRSPVHGLGRLVVLLVALFLVVSACGGGGDPETSGGAAGTSATAPTELLAVDEFVALLPVFEGTPDEVMAEGQRVIRQRLVDELGLADVLTPELFAAGDLLASQLFEQEFPDLGSASGVNGLRSAQTLRAPSLSVARLQQAPPLSGLWTAPSWASSALSGLWQDAKTSGEVSSDPQSRDGTKKDESRGITTKIKSSYSRQGRQLVAEVTYTVTYTVDGKAYTEVTHVSVKADACPDADGVLTITYDIDYSLTGGKTATRTAAGTATAHVGDDAFLQSIDHEAETDVDAGSPVRLGYSTPVTTRQEQGTGTERISVGKVDITSGSGLEGKSDLQLFEAGMMIFFISDSLVEKVADHAQDAWRNGGCVFIVVPEGTDHKLKAHQSFTFTARVDHRFESGNVPLPVSAELSGDGTLAPGRIDPAPDTFVMTAGVGKFDTVALETTSRRGRDTETVHFEIEEVSITLAFTGTFDYDFGVIKIHGDVEIPPITLTADFEGEFIATGPVELALTADIPDCSATGRQTGGEITLTGKLQTRESGEVLTLLAEDSEGGELTLACPLAAAISSGGFGAGGAALINLSHIAIPLEEGTYPFQNDDTTAGVHFVVQGEVTLTFPPS